VRIDTHADNKVMQHVLEKRGFRRTGIIYLENGDPRIAFEKV
jgi:RimJ/RimL family protein N-acetyltransferase